MRQAGHLVVSVLALCILIARSETMLVLNCIGLGFPLGNIRGIEKEGTHTC